MGKKIKRPVLRYHGGKFMLSNWIISHFPEHRIYVEPYGGGASVMMQKRRCYAEVLNDKSLEVVNVFQVLRDPEQSRELARLCALTPYSREEFDRTYEDDHGLPPVERARRTIFRSFAGFSSGSTIKKYKTGFRGTTKRTHTSPAHDWAIYPEYIPLFTDRLRGVTIESMHAPDLMKAHDSPETLHYLDPTYLKSTRNSNGSVYEFEMTEDDHREMAEVAKSMEGMVIISGYPSELYDQELFPDWGRSSRMTNADSREPREEVLWMNEAVCSRVMIQGELF